MSGDRYGSRELTERELEIMKFLTDGLKNREIGAAVGMSEHVVKNHLIVIYDKLGMNNRTEVALWYVAHVEMKRG